MTPATWTLSIPWGDYLKCESLVCLIRMTKCIRWNSFLFTGSIVPISPVLWLKTWDLCIIKVIKATICTSKLFTKKQETDRGPRGDKMCSLWPVAVPWLPRVSLPRSGSSERSTTLLSEPRDELRWPKTIRVKPFNHKLWPWSVF